jgi:hypothetical protein
MTEQSAIAQAARLPVVVKVLLNHNDKGVTGIYARWHMFEEKREAVMAIEAAMNLTFNIPDAKSVSDSKKCHYSLSPAEKFCFQAVT